MPEKYIIYLRPKKIVSPRHFFYWSSCSKSGQWAVTYICVRDIDFVSFYYFSIWFWNCSDGVVTFVFFTLVQSWQKTKINMFFSLIFVCQNGKDILTLNVQSESLPLMKYCRQFVVRNTSKNPLVPNVQLR